MSEAILCDTCIIIDFLNENSLLLYNQQQAEKILMVNSIIEMELLQGAHNKHELRMIEKKLNTFTRLDMQQDIFDLAIRLLRKYGLSHGLMLPDAVIAATAVFYNIPLLTYNRKDFRFIPDIQLPEILMT